VLLVMGTSAGGVGRHVAGLAGSLVGAGHDVTVAAPADAIARVDLAAVATSVVPLRVRDRPDPPGDVRAVAALSRLARDADIMHAHGLRVGALAALAVRHRGRPPLAVTLHNAAPAGRLAGWVYAALERLVARRADLVLGVSADLVDRMSALRARRVDLAVIAAPGLRVAMRARDEVRAELGLEPGTALAVVVARLAAQKGLDQLLDAHGALRDLDLLTVVAGDGPLRAALQRRVTDERLPVRLLGHRDDVPALLAAADVVVSSAVWEGQPVGLQEALRVGAAIVATDAGGTAATLGDAAVLVAGADVAALARAVREVVLDDGVRDALRSKAVARAADLPTDADARDAALAAYESLRMPADRPGRGPRRGHLPPIGES
jgi:glycosyltransferase involved in cell wall biosynthesis